MTNVFIEHFDDGIEPQLENLGGKGASLVTMTAAGMPVPPGFVITTSAFDSFIGTTLVEQINELLAGLDADDVAAVDEISAKIRALILECPVPEDVREATHVAYERLQSQFATQVPVAVRSSATAEDLPDASFAGQQDTYLWLNGYDAVTEHIRQCWASLFTSRAILYRLKNDIPNEGLSMAVVVQKMVNSSAAGVAMTLDPTNGDRSKITVDASYGVGETVVSGTVTPDNIQLDKVTLDIITEHIGEKHVELICDAATNSLIERDVEEARQHVRSLTDDQLTAVAQLAKRAEKHYGTPQDIEWSVDADLPDGENILLLQSRPETVHSAKKPAAKPAATTGGFAASLGLSSSITSMTASFLKS
ncbi:MAG: PEP/pyruvate-binding domain-containing protein [Micrococcaceae bacterium]|nr:PEP/pyruvate-binding domain-containing protein [Micrococcaceae bacterium]